MQHPDDENDMNALFLFMAAVLLGVPAMARFLKDLFGF